MSCNYKTIRTMQMFICILLILGGCASKAPATTPSPVSAQQSTELLESTKTPTVTSAQVNAYAGSTLPGFADGTPKKCGFVKPYGLWGAPEGGLLIADNYANLLRACHGNIVSTEAGNVRLLDQNGYPLADYFNGQANNAVLNHPRFVTVSKEGVIVFSDTGNHCLRVVQNGMVRLLAGNGNEGFLNGNYATAQFNTPSGVAIGQDGAIYVADTLNHCIRVVSPQGAVTTLAGTPEIAGMKDGPVSEASFNEPNDIQLSVDGALYVVDKGNQRIRKIVNGTVTTVAGSGAKIDSDTGYIEGGYRDGQVLQAQFQYPTGLFVTEDGTVYVADTGNNCIRVIEPEGQVKTVAGSTEAGNINGPGTTARFNQPLDVYLEEGILYVSDSYNHTIRAVSIDSETGGATE